MILDGSREDLLINVIHIHQWILSSSLKNHSSLCIWPLNIFIYSLIWLYFYFLFFSGTSCYRKERKAWIYECLWADIQITRLQFRKYVWEAQGMSIFFSPVSPPTHTHHQENKKRKIFEEMLPTNSKVVSFQNYVKYTIHSHLPMITVCLGFHTTGFCKERNKFCFQDAC